MSEKYNLGEFLNLLVDSFDDQEIQLLSYSSFRQVFEKFTPEMEKSAKILKLVDHCKRRGILDDLLEIVAVQNPYQYEIYKKSLFKDNTVDFNFRSLDINSKSIVQLELIGPVIDFSNKDFRKEVEAKIGETFSRILNIPSNKSGFVVRVVRHIRDFT